MNITKEQLKTICPITEANASIYVPLLNKYMAVYGIITAKQVCCFLAQIAHESGNFAHVTENLNYSADALRRVFPKYFTPQLAQTYARQPMKIANRVYANRYGNGNEASGDGWRYRGRGLIQLTFKANYVKYGYAENPDMLVMPEHAVECACKYWKANNLNRFADADNFTGLTKAINGGTNGLTERTKLWQKAKSCIR